MKVDFKNKKLMSSEDLDQKAIEFAVNEAKLQLSADILATEKSLASKKSELADAKCTTPLNATNIVNLQIEVEGLEDGLKRLHNLAKEFGFEE